MKFEIFFHLFNLLWILNIVKYFWALQIFHFSELKKTFQLKTYFVYSMFLDLNFSSLEFSIEWIQWKMQGIVKNEEKDGGHKEGRPGALGGRVGEKAGRNEKHTCPWRNRVFWDGYKCAVRPTRGKGPDQSQPFPWVTGQIFGGLHVDSSLVWR